MERKQLMESCAYVLVGLVAWIVFMVFSHWLYSDVRTYLEFLPALSFWEYFKTLVLLQILGWFVFPHKIDKGD